MLREGRWVVSGILFGPELHEIAHCHGKWLVCLGEVGIYEM